MSVFARGQITFVYAKYGLDKSSVRSRWVEINGTDSLVTTGTKGSYYTVKNLALKYGQLMNSVVLGYNGKVLLYNGKALKYRGLKIIDLDIAYELLRAFLVEAGLNDGEDDFINGFDWDTYSELLTDYQDAERVAYDDINTALQKYVEYSKEQMLASLREFEALVNSTIDEMQDVLDNTIETYFYSGVPSLSTAPASSWSSSEYASHLGDMYYDNDTGTGYRFQVDNGTYFWKVLSDSTATTALAAAYLAQDTADSKRRVFRSQPGIDNAYDVGDLWLNATVTGTASGDVTNEMLVATTAKESGTSFSASHWTLATKYTDNALAQSVQNALTYFINNTYADAISGINTQLDQKAETYFSATNPAANWTSAEMEVHTGDLWYNTKNETISGTGWSVEPGQSAMWDGSKWVVSEVPSAVFDRIDGKANIYTDATQWGNDLHIRDIFIPATDLVLPNKTYKENKVYRCTGLNPVTFVEIGYTDDSAINYLKTALSKDNTVISGGLVLGSFIGVKNSSNNVVAAINAASIVGFDPNASSSSSSSLVIGTGSSSGSSSDNNYGILMFAAGISTLSTAYTTAAFRVYSSGRMEATSGKIGGWNITDSSLYSDTPSGWPPTGYVISGITLSVSSSVTYAISAGSVQGSYDGPNFGVKKNGEVVARHGTIGGWSITYGRLSSGSGSNYVALNTGEHRDTESSSSDTNDSYSIWAGAESASSAPFSVTKAGVISSTSGTIGGWTLGATRLSSGSSTSFVGLDSGTSGVNYVIWAGAETPLYASFSVTRGGVVYAKSGWIGGWSISATQLNSGSTTSFVALDSGTSGVSYAMWAGNSTASSAPFSVTRAGALKATNATITGSITTTSGSLGGWTIDGNELYSGSSTSYLELNSDSQINYAMLAGGTGTQPGVSGRAPFLLQKNGDLYVNNIYGKNITAGDFEIDGSSLSFFADEGSETTYLNIDSDGLIYEVYDNSTLWGYFRCGTDAYGSEYVLEIQTQTQGVGGLFITCNQGEDAIAITNGNITLGSGCYVISPYATITNATITNATITNATITNISGTALSPRKSYYYTTANLTIDGTYDVICVGGSGSATITFPYSSGFDGMEIKVFAWSNFILSAPQGCEYYAGGSTRQGQSLSLSAGYCYVAIFGTDGTWYIYKSS